MTLRGSYAPSDSPPPYPGAFDGTPEEKVPLSETQFVNADTEDSPRRFQLTPLLSPDERSPSACQAIPEHNDQTLCNGSINPWNHMSSFAAHSAHNAKGAFNDPGHKSMQSAPLDSCTPGSASDASGISQRCSDSGNANHVTPDGESSAGASNHIMPFQGQDTCNGAALDRQNCNNEQRQLYNMVLVGVEPDLTTDLVPQA